MADDEKSKKSKIDVLSGSVKDFKDGLGDSLSAVTDLNQKFKELEKSTKGLKGDLDIQGYIKASTAAVKLLNKEYSNINGVIDKILEGKAKSNDLTKLEESTTNAITKLGERREANQSKINQLTEESKNKNKKNTEVILSQIKALEEVNEALADEQGQLEKNKGVAKELQEEFDKQSKAMGPGGQILELMGHNIKGLDKFTGEAAEKMRTYAANTKDSHTFTGQMKTAMVGVKATLGAAVTHAVSFQSVFGFLIHAALHTDKILTSIGKNMNISREQAAEIEHHYAHMAASSEYSSINISSLVEAQSQLADATGITAGFSDEQLEQQAVLTKQMGLSATEAAKINNLSKLNNQSTQETKLGIANQVVNLTKQTGIRLDLKKVMQDVSKVEGQLSMQYKNNPELIAKAVIQAQKLGITLQQAASMGKNLLNWESSIEAELEAELLTNKQLNLEEARNLALKGKSAEAATLLLKQVGSAAEFSNMDMIQQEAIAKSMGMSTDELSNSLIQQELLNKYGKEELDRLMATEDGRRQLREEGAGDLVAAAEQQSQQEKMNDLITKMSEILQAAVSGPFGMLLGIIVEVLGYLGTVVSYFTSMFSWVGKITAKLGSLGGAFKALGYLAVVGAAYTAYKFASMVPVVGPALGMVAAATVLTAGMGALNKKMNDGVMAPDGKVLYSGKEGAIKLNDNDTVVAGTDLGGGKSGKSKSEGKSGAGGGTTDLSPLIAKVDQLISLLQKGSQVTLDGKAVGRALGLNSVNANMA